MICIVLAAGYATRLYPLTENFPKPLLEIKGKTILDWLIDDIQNSGKIEEYVVVSNHAFVHHFEKWAKGRKETITILDDGTESNETRLGAVKDIKFAMDELHIEDDILVIAGDNVLDFSLCKFIDYAVNKKQSAIMRYYEPGTARLQKSGVVVVDDHDKILSMVEKPKEPQSNWCCPPFYYYIKEDAKRLDEAISDGCNTDAPGSYVAWLSEKNNVYAMEMPGKRYDIGTVENYTDIKEHYMGIQKFKPLDLSKTILVTGAAGFIGFHLSRKLLAQGVKVIGIDNINDYYDTALKYARLKILEKQDNFTFVKGSIADKDAVDALFKTYQPQIVINLAAQAGVRYSIDNPGVYIESNIIGFFNILEACRHNPVEHLLYASSSSVYGNQEKTPFSTDDDVSKPISLYAATKKSNELMAYTYSHLYGIPSTGLRFFTVYGPFGRPDMAYFSFTNKIFADETIKIFNNGDMYRDFTYVDDIVQGIENMICNPPKADQNGDRAIVYNIGNNNPEKLMYFIETLERCLGKTAKKEFYPMQPGDVYQTYADVTPLMRDFDFKPSTSIEDGLTAFAKWYKEYYNK